ncbi:hypothetical protein H696_05902 [Fonticula alba]|uniref:THIF-type NAD/FAD binding fold domain-containing protein n=1 Tax=Fonticula alba TaxID=691883 RepID=A0A058Z041_FONAL|nr:hypothetical protein H696_05902 [Fonticula alba]KCV67615.1 hypothetical protein H696_05902 [Fonticula alba]|eukprot:XP_009497953.1 hypothetical protein H696_05902 [Fonticula alba]
MDRFDRQVRIWGPDAQARLQGSSVLVVGSSGLAAEVVRQLLLCGIGRVDWAGSPGAEAGAHFFAGPDDDPLEALRELSPDSTLALVTEAALQLLDLGPYDAILLDHVPLDRAAVRALEASPAPVVLATTASMHGLLRLCGPDIVTFEPPASTTSPARMHLRLDDRPPAALRLWAARLARGWPQLTASERAALPFPLVLAVAILQASGTPQGAADVDAWPEPGQGLDRRALRSALRGLFPSGEGSPPRCLAEAEAALSFHALGRQTRREVQAFEALLARQPPGAEAGPAADVWLFARAVAACLAAAPSTMPLGFAPFEDMDSSAEHFRALEDIYRRQSAADTEQLLGHVARLPVPGPEHAVSAIRAGAASLARDFQQLAFRRVFLSQAGALSDDFPLLGSSPDAVMAALDAGLPGPAAVGRSPAIQEAARAGASDPRLRALLLWYAAGLACLAGGETRLDGMSIFRQDRRLAAALRLVTNVELREVLTQEDLLGLRAALAADIRWLANSGGAEIHVTAAMTAGLAVQELIKILGRKGVPATGTVFLNSRHPSILATPATEH